jgi:hypothetical protein
VTPPPTAGRTLNILDTVCVLHFAASNQAGLLVRILTAADYHILIPHEVMVEADRRARLEGWDLTGLRRHLGGRITVIPEITANAPASVELLAKIRDRHPAGSAGSTDLGECVVVARALEARQRKIDVVVSIDDLRGQQLATAHGLKLFTVEDALFRGVKLDVLTRAQAKAAYLRMVPFGSSLPTWPASTLKPRLGY